MDKDEVKPLKRLLKPIVIWSVGIVPVGTSVTAAMIHSTQSNSLFNFMDDFFNIIIFLTILGILFAAVPLFYLLGEKAEKISADFDAKSKMYLGNADDPNISAATKADNERLAHQFAVKAANAKAPIKSYTSGAKNFMRAIWFAMTGFIASLTLDIVDQTEITKIPDITFGNLFHYQDLGYADEVIETFLCSGAMGGIILYITLGLSQISKGFTKAG